MILASHASKGLEVFGEFHCLHVTETLLCVVGDQSWVDDELVMSCHVEHLEGLFTSTINHSDTYNFHNTDHEKIRGEK